MGNSRYQLGFAAKARYAKGEITEEEFEEIKSIGADFIDIVETYRYNLRVLYCTI